LTGFSETGLVTGLSVVVVKDMMIYIGQGREVRESAFSTDI